VPVLAVITLAAGYLGEVGRVAQLPVDAPNTLRGQAETGLHRYLFPQILVTVLGTYALQTLALVYLGIALTVTEFSTGTARSWLVAAGDRRLYLRTRTVTLATISVLVVAELVAIGLSSSVLPLGNSDSALASSPDVAPPGIAISIGATLLGAFFCVAAGAFVAMLTRNGLFTLIALIFYELAEVTVSGLPILRDGPLGNVGQFLPTEALMALRVSSAAAAGVPSPDTPIGLATGLALPAASAVVGLWTLLALGGMWARFLRMDITE
jgi:hypothetical protein